MRGAIAAATCALGCTSVLGIDGTYANTPQAICDRVATLCSSTIPSFNEQDCIASFPPAGVNYTAYTECASMNDCNSFVACAQANIGFSSATCSFGSVKGRPCVVTAGVCCTQFGSQLVCSGAAGNAGVCAPP